MIRSGSATLLGVLSIAASFAVLSSAMHASAHTTGLSWIATSSPYVVDIGYDPNEFQAGLSARFDFQLLGERSGDLVMYDHVWVRLVKDERTLLATGIRQQEIGPTTLLYAFLAPGSYEIEASYRDADGKDLAVATFPIPVRSAPASPRTYLIWSALVATGLALGVLSTMAVVRRK